MVDILDPEKAHLCWDNKLCAAEMLKINKIIIKVGIQFNNLRELRLFYNKNILTLQFL